MVSKKLCYIAVIIVFSVFTLLSSVRGQCSEAGITLNGTTGSFASPNYPSNYPNRKTCRWIIEVPQEHVVHLSFNVFVMEKCAIPSPTCSCDHVEIRDGPNVNSPKLAKYCGDENPGAIMSSGRFMWVEFDSDFFSNAQGFLATYIAVDASECPRGKILSGTNGSLTTPRFPVRYPNSVKCTWIIQVPEGFQVRLRFDSFRLETCTLPSVCSCDHVRVRDGRDESSQSLAKLCGDHSPTILRSSGQTLWVEFESDSLTGGQGFSATFKAVPESDCPRDGYILRGTNGSISSPEYPLSYPDSVKCTWIIEVPEGYRVRLEFQSFQLETCTIPSVCTCDHVEVRDGRDATGNSLERSCGDKKPSHSRSSGRFMWIEFESDSKTTRNGFHAIFNALSVNECPTRGVLQGTNGSFSSPQYPLNYPNSVTCTWIIEVPEGYQVQLTFNTFKLEDCAISSICTCDHVEVRDGQTENSPSLKKHCGNEKPTPLRSSGRYMWVEFDSDSKTTEKGFNASFVAVSDSECPRNGLLKGKVGNFSSPGYPKEYPNSVTCTWVIEVPENHLVELTFDDFELEDCFISPICTCDHVEVRDGKDKSASELDEFCGDDKPSTLISTGRYMWVEFEADSSTNRKGFLATYKAIKTGMYCNTAFGWNISAIGCIAATVGVLGGGVFIIVLMCIVLVKKPNVFKCKCRWSLFGSCFDCENAS